MTEYASTESGNREKIKTPFAKIIVNNGAGDTYYHVMWWQDGEMQIGFGSRNLQFVRKWLSDEFEVDTPEADVAPVVRCKDCEYAERYERTNGTAGYYCGHPKNRFTYGERWDRVFKPVKEANDFCSYGEYQTNTGGNGNVSG